MDQLVKTIVVELNQYQTVLDVGVGTGRFAKPLQDNGFAVFGVDIGHRMLKRAMEKGVDNLFLGDACFLPFRDYSFDATVCIHLLHLITEWKMALEEICRVTREVMLSVVYTSKNVVGQAYNSILEDYGYKGRRLGKGERELKDIVEPAKAVFATTFESSVDEYLEHLSRRAYSRQWHIPDYVNRKVVDELKRKFGGKVFPAELRVLLWNIEDVEEYCRNFK